MVGTHANVVKKIKDFEVLAGSGRIGVSRALEKLDLPSDGRHSKMKKQEKIYSQE